MNMQRFRVLIALAVILALSGCYVQSLYPICDADAAVEVPALVGDWRAADDSDENPPTWQFQEGGTIVTREDGVASELEAVYFRVGGHLFADWTAGEIGDDGCVNTYWRIHVVPTHSVHKVDLQGDHLTITPLHPEFAKDFAEADPERLPYLLGQEEDSILYVALPDEWHAFLLEHATNAKAFKPDSAMKFVRLPTPDAEMTNQDSAPPSGASEQDPR